MHALKALGLLAACVTLVAAAPMPIEGGVSAREAIVAKSAPRYFGGVFGERDAQAETDGDGNGNQRRRGDGNGNPRLVTDGDGNGNPRKRDDGNGNSGLVTDGDGSGNQA